MPQKKNPDMCELIRGKTGRVYGDLIALLTVMKGLPLSYNRDMQEDKEPLFDAADTVAGCLSVFARMAATLKFNPGRFEAEPDGLLATELADYLVRKGMSFRKAHAVVGAIARESLDRGKNLASLSLETYRRHSKLFDRDVYAVLDMRASVRMKRSEGSTSPAEVARALNSWNAKLSAASSRARPSRRISKSLSPRAGRRGGR
jgi:argininosuccinate lyase